MDLLYDIVLYPIIFILPAYVANSSPVLFGGGTPIDFNKKLWGKPIFGPHKTWSGLIAGIVLGILTGYVESIFLPYMAITGIALTLGTHAGDLLGSFVKRRMGTASGTEVMLLDQYPFLILALVFAYPLGNMPGIYGVLFLLVVTGLVHRYANIIAHRIKLKAVPW